MKGSAFAISLVVACAAATPMLMPREAHAQSKSDKDERAKELFKKGDTAYAEARYEDALAAFQEAYDLSGRPQLFFSIANALERLGRYEDAANALEKYLASGKAKDQAIVQSRLTNLRKRVDDQKKEDEAKRARADDEKKKRDADEEKKRKAAAVPPPKPFPILPWALIGGGGVLVVTGSIFGVLTLGARSDAKAGCTDAPAGHLCTSDARSALDREKTFGVVADVGVLAGLVLAGVGTYFLLVPTDAAEVHVGARGIDLVGRF